MTGYEVAIPSYQRRVMLVSRTLPVLRRGGIDPDRITVFVADADEHRAYSKALPAGSVKNIVIAAPQLRGARNFINRYYPSGQRLIQCDDDIDAVLAPDAAGVLKPVADLDALFRRGFAELDNHGATLFGLYPVPNAFFMRGAPVTTDLRLIVGSLWGTINEPGAPHCQTLIEEKEDYLRTVLHYLHAGKVVRLNDVAIKTRYYGNEGGMQISRTFDKQSASCQYLLDTYPELVHPSKPRKSGYPEVRLRDARKKVAV